MYMHGQIWTTKDVVWVKSIYDWQLLRKAHSSMAVFIITTPAMKAAFLQQNYHQSPKNCLTPLSCLPQHQVCGSCGGRGWVPCAFCKGKKTDIRGDNGNRIYRRCPDCKTVGWTICSKCKVYRCVTFPDANDEELIV